MELESAVYYCCLEALQNSAKHGGPHAHPSIAAEELDGRLVFAVADRGLGFDLLTVTRGDGLRNMHDRIATVGGLLEIASTPGHGTTVSGSVPI
jgi:signal transduction histidine kinase